MRIRDWSSDGCSSDLPCASAAVRARRACSRSSEESDRTGRSRPARSRERSFAMSAIGIIATLRVQPDKTEAFEGVFAELAAAVRANEPGNSLYRLFRTDEAGVYKVMECYDDARSEEHTSELQSLMRISYAVFCLKKKKKQKQSTNTKTTKN